MPAAEVVIDPNWLLSTTAQSSAALVGIIGALLVTRLVSLSGERMALERQASQLNDELSRQDNLLREVDDKEWTDLRYRFISASITEAFENRGQETPEDIVGRYLSTYRDWPHREASAYIPVAAELLEIISDAFEQATQHRDNLDPNDLSGSGINVRPDWEDVYRSAALILVSPEAQSPMAAHSIAMTLMLNKSRPFRADDELERHRHRKSEIRQQIAGLRGQLRITELGIDRVGNVANMLPLVAIPAGFALVGIVLPVGLMALRPVPNAAAVRALVAVLFTAAILTLLGYLASEVRRLSRALAPAQPALLTP